MNWAISRDPGAVPMLIEATAKGGDKALLEWWRVRHGVVFGQRELELAAGHGNVDLVKHLLGADGADWDLEAALAAIRAPGQEVHGHVAQDVQHIISGAIARRAAERPVDE
ncbi:hypothetical protein HK105_209379 [Polyrhizophydium stewartii]|uniref:Ankyrin repeat protein n=1 Tax=Polyrhizophydium stewartii TaxID=2732419 RepID=A0ABR4MV77_9FUNG